MRINDIDNATKDVTIANTNRKRNFTLEEKYNIIKDISNYPILSEGLKKYNLSISTYYKWKRLLGTLDDSPRRINLTNEQGEQILEVIEKKKQEGYKLKVILEELNISYNVYYSLLRRRKRREVKQVSFSSNEQLSRLRKIKTSIVKFFSKFFVR